MLYRSLVLLSASILALGACTHQTNESAADNDPAMRADSLAENIRILASDEFQGRKPFTSGEAKTVQFLEQRFAALGLEPGNGKSYLQPVPMVNIATQAAPSMQVAAPRGNFVLNGLDDYVIWTEKTDSVISLDKDELVFAGYGVVAPEYNWNDYAGLDAKGKIVLVMVNDPGFGADPSLFKGDTMTYYGRWTYKFEEAARQGAKGCLIIHNTKGASYPFSVVQNNWNGSRLRLDDRGNEQKYCSAVGWVTQQTAHRLLTAAGQDTTLYAKANKPGFKPVPLGVRLSTRIQVKATYDKSQNVIAKISGSVHPDEYIIYTAHWDHIGIGKPDERGDSIYNGALDNASATAGLLELARAFKQAKTPPARSIVFLSVTAEEQGLWGSAYYALNPVYPLRKTVANINMDVLNAYGKTKDIVVVGRGQSELEDYLKQEAEKQARVVSFESHPESGYYYRSDHFNFAKVGVPALYINNGVDVIGKDKAYGQQMAEEYTTKHYHRPSDEYSEKWNLGGAIADLQLVFAVGQRLAGEEKWPVWKASSEFKAIREKSMVP